MITLSAAQTTEPQKAADERKKRKSLLSSRMEIASAG
jgi:hypothetical protein